MKRHLQTPGVRPWAGEDLIDLQNESLKTIDAFFGEYGNCIFNGVEVRPVSGNIYNITPGFVALAGTDPDGLPVYRVVPFDGAENLSLPVYLSLSYSVIEREYADQKVKPVAYDYKAVASAVRPAENTECLEITASGGRRFVDAVGLTDKLSHTGNGKDVTVTFSESENRINMVSGEKMSLLWGKVRKWFSDLKTVAFSGRAADLSDDDTHRFATDTEKAVWNDKYTRAETDSKDTDTLAAAKTYVLDRIAEIVGGSPNALNTLYELAAALNNDPAFATTIMALVNGKAPLVHTHTVSQITDFPASLPASDVHVWAKQPEKPAYSPSEIGAYPISGGEIRGSIITNNPIYAAKGVIADTTHYGVIVASMQKNPVGCYYAFINSGISSYGIGLTEENRLMFGSVASNGNISYVNKLAYTSEIPTTPEAIGAAPVGHNHNGSQFLASNGATGGYSFAGDVATDTGMFSDSDGDLYFMQNGVKTTFADLSTAAVRLIADFNTSDPGVYVVPGNAVGGPKPGDPLFQYLGFLSIFTYTPPPNPGGTMPTSLTLKEFNIKIDNTLYQFVSPPSGMVEDWVQTLPLQNQVQTGTKASYNDYTETGKYYLFDVPDGPPTSGYFVLLEVEVLPSGAIYQTVKDLSGHRDDVISYVRACVGRNHTDPNRYWSEWQSAALSLIPAGTKSSYNDYIHTGKYYVDSSTDGPDGGYPYFAMLEVEALENGSVIQTAKLVNYSGGGYTIDIYTRIYFSPGGASRWNPWYLLSGSGNTTASATY